MKSLLQILIVWSFGINIYSQLSPAWILTLGSSQADAVISAETDISDNIYLTGYFSGVMNFDTIGNGIYITPNEKDVFILKLTSEGRTVWAKSLSGPASDIPTAIQLDSDNNIYIVGSFRNSLDLDPSENSSYQVSSQSDYDMFLVKLDNNGNFLWGYSWDLSPAALRIDGNNNIFVGGTFSGTVDFDPSSGQSLKSSNGGTDVFLLKMNSDGSFIYAKTVGGNGNDSLYCFALDARSDLVLAGTFEQTADFDPSTGSYNLSATGNSYDIFLLKLDNNGNFLWAKSEGGNLYEWPNDIITDADNNLYLTGGFYGTADFDPGPDTHNITSQAGYTDSYVQKLDADGNLILVKSFGNNTFDQGEHIALDSANNVFISGTFRFTLDLDPSNAVFNVTSNGDKDIYLLKWDNNGNFLQGGALGGGAPDMGNVLIYRNNALYFGGAYYGVADLDLTSTVANYPSNLASLDLFLEKIGSTTNDLQTAVHNSIKVYPTLTQAFIQVEVSDNSDVPKFKIVNILGHKSDITFRKINSHTYQMDISMFKRGIYFLEVTSGKQVNLFKIIKM